MKLYIRVSVPYGELCVEGSNNRPTNHFGIIYFPFFFFFLSLPILFILPGMEHMP